MYESTRNNLCNSLYGELNDVPAWYALHTRSRHEKKISEKLTSKGVAHYLPLNTVYRRWSDRYKQVTEPLFSCYVFVNIKLRDRLLVLQTEGAVNLVLHNGKPARIPEMQIQAIQRILQEQKTIEPADYFTPGQKVRVVRGPFEGIEGILESKRNNHRLVLAIEGIRQAVSVEIDPRELEVIGG